MASLPANPLPWVEPNFKWWSNGQNGVAVAAGNLLKRGWHLVLVWGRCKCCKTAKGTRWGESAGREMSQSKKFRKFRGIFVESLLVCEGWCKWCTASQIHLQIRRTLAGAEVQRGRAFIKGPNEYPNWTVWFFRPHIGDSYIDCGPSKAIKIANPWATLCLVWKSSCTYWPSCILQIPILRISYCMLFALIYFLSTSSPSHQRARRFCATHGMKPTCRARRLSSCWAKSPAPSASRAGGVFSSISSPRRMGSTVQLGTSKNWGPWDQMGFLDEKYTLGRSPILKWCPICQNTWLRQRRNPFWWPCEAPV